MAKFILQHEQYRGSTFRDPFSRRIIDKTLTANQKPVKFKRLAYKKCSTSQGNCFLAQSFLISYHTLCEWALAQKAHKSFKADDLCYVIVMFISM